MPDISAAEKLTEDPSANKALFEVTRRIMIVWSKNLIIVSLNLTVHNPVKKISSFELDKKRVHVFWGLRQQNSEVVLTFGILYVALVSEDVVVLLLGDIKNTHKRTESRPSLIDATLIYKKENIFGNKWFSTRAKFDQNSRKEHDIVIENSITGSSDPEMWISVDGIKFRGNETIIVNKSPVQVFCDVHDWLFGRLLLNSFGNPSRHGMFIFRHGALEYNDVNNTCSAGGSETGDGSSAGGTDTYISADNRPTATPDFSLFLYAWEIE
ncbi:hypothetical protein MKX01_006800 [Papaver californicum]|nr:hypothetical protein MKX01_006800 [Papaver californicum]